MARLATTSDAFNAVAEPQRRQILDALIRGEKSVTQVVDCLQIRQPQASKHLAVLKKVGLVSSRSVGKQHMYSINPAGLKPIYEWVKSYEQFWRESFDRLDDYLQELQSQEKQDDDRP